MPRIARALRRLGAGALLALLLNIPAGIASAPTHEERAPSHCPRHCMEGLIDRYVAALARHDPSGLPLARDVRFTENAQQIAIGEGLWRTATQAPQTFKIYGVDPMTGQAGLIGLMKEQGVPVLLALRLKVVNGRIIEVEHLIARDLAPTALPNLVTPRAALLADVPAAERTPREDMINAVDSYFDAITHGDGSIAPFAEDCERHENGRQTSLVKKSEAQPIAPTSTAETFALLMTYTCRAQLDTGVFAYIFRIWPRRITIIDEQRGLVWAFPSFNEGGGTGRVELKGVPSIQSMAVKPVASTHVGLEVFKIRGGRIHEIEGAGSVALPYGAQNGWY
jgi:hypothetical protein